MMWYPWSTPWVHAVVPTRLSLTLKYSWPLWYQRICSSAGLRRSTTTA